MIRNSIVFLLFVFGAFFAGIYFAYDSIDPCRALAVEEARRSQAPTAVAELWTRLRTAGMNPASCSKRLVVSWYERVMP